VKDALGAVTVVEGDPSLTVEPMVIQAGSSIEEEVQFSHVNVSHVTIYGVPIYCHRSNQHRLSRRCNSAILISDPPTDAYMYAVA